MRPASHDPYAYRGHVPAFDEDRVLLVMDGECALCSAAARRIARWDREDAVRIATSQSPLGRALLALYGMDPDDPDTWLMIEGGRAFGSMDAILRLGRRLHPAFRMLAPLGLLPFAAQDWLYARIARNRYAMFGKADMCAMPDEALRRKLVHR